MIEDGAKRALQDLGAVNPYEPGRPCEVKVELAVSSDIDEYRNKRGVEVVEPRVIVSTAEDWWTAWRQFYL